jgi:serine protease Do
MKRVLLTISLTLLPILSLAHLPAKVMSENPSLAPMLKKTTPAVVNILATKAPKAVAFATPELQTPSSKNSQPPRSLPNQPQRPTLSLGSGVIFDAKHGLLVTNAHVVHDAKLLVVTLKDGRRLRGHLIGEDDGFDIAIIKIPAKHLTALPFGDSNRLRVGDFVATIGSPFGLTQTVTSGVISALDRSEPKIEGFQSFIQTDAPINPGNSGGALINLNGQLIGINTAILTPMYANIGIGFAIPSNMVESVLKQLLQYGHVKRGMLGVIVQTMTPSLAEAMHFKHHQGALVTTVVAGSPASKAGIKPEDLITTINKHPIRTSAQLRNSLGLMRPGTAVHIQLIRNHQLMERTAIVADPLKFQPPHSNPFLAGMNLQKFSQLQGDGTTLIGVRITGVTPSSAGFLAGLAPGDVITQANGKAVYTPKQLEDIANQNKDEGLLVKVFRGMQAIYTILQ